jgi:hypothetical protein
MLSLTEKWVENDERVELPGFRRVSQFERNTVRTGGVAIYENKTAAPAIQSADYELLKYDEKKQKVERIATAHDGVGDICSVQTTINGQRVLLVCVHYARYSNT